MHTFNWHLPERVGVKVWRIGGSQAPVGGLSAFTTPIRIPPSYWAIGGVLGSTRSCTPVGVVAERVGFEPTVPCGTTVFETARIGHSRTSPIGFQPFIGPGSILVGEVLEKTTGGLHRRPLQELH